MPRNWTAEELAAVLARNAAFKVSTARPKPPPEIHSRQFPASTKPAANGIHELMACQSYQGTLQPEEELSYRLAKELRRLTNSGILKCVWFRIPNEHPEGGRYGMIAQVKRIALGAVPGAPDFGFMWSSGGGFIELKTEAAQSSLLGPSGKLGIRKGKRSYLRGRQRLFQTWAEGYGVQHAICRSVPDALSCLRSWGVLT